MIEPDSWSSSLNSFSSTQKVIWRYGGWQWGEMVQESPEMFGRDWFCPVLE